MNDPLNVSLNTGELPDDLAVRVLRIYGADEQSDLPALIRSTGATPAQLATVIARQCFSSDWHGRMAVQTRDRIKCELENHFTVLESAPADPIAQSWQNGPGQFDAYRRHNEVHDPRYVQVVGGAQPVESSYNRESGTGTIKLGGDGA